jgi:uncharacterized protein
LHSESSGDPVRAVGALSRSDLRIALPALVVAEVTFFVGRRLGAPAESAFLRGLGALDVEAPSNEDFDHTAQPVDHHADFPLGGTDASVIALVERLDAPILVTLDHRHFATDRPHHREAFELLP